MDPATLTAGGLAAMFFGGLASGAGSGIGSGIAGEIFGGSPMEPGKARPQAVGAGYGQALANVGGAYDTRLMLPARQNIPYPRGGETPRHDRVANLMAIQNIRSGLS